MIIACRRPLTIQRYCKMHLHPRRVNARPRRTRVVTTAFDPGMLVHGVQLTTTMFTTAVFIYSSLNYLMYRRLRKEHEKNEEEKKKK